MAFAVDNLIGGNIAEQELGDEFQYYDGAASIKLDRPWRRRGPTSSAADRVPGSAVNVRMTPRPRAQPALPR